MSTLNVRLLGPGSITRGDEVRRPHSRKTLALLAYLILETRRAHPRAQLASMLWPACSPTSARQSLRQALYWLGKASDAKLHNRLADPELVQLAVVTDAELDIDVTRFLSLVESTAAADWRDAAALYDAPLLDGQAFDGCDEFEAWLICARENLQSLAIQNLDRLTVQSIARGEWDDAYRHATALRKLGSMDEAATRHLFRIYAARNEPRLIDAEWERLRGVMRRELNVEPSPPTRELYLSLRGVHRPSWVGVPDRAAGDAAESAHAQPAAATSPDPGAAEPIVRAGRAAERVHAYGHALELYERALQILNRAGPAAAQRRCQVLILKEGALDRLGRRAEQSATIDDAIREAETLGDPSQLATLLLRRAGARAYCGDSHGACDAAMRALQIHRALNDRPGEAESLRELGFAHWRARDYPAALEHARQALALHRSLGDVCGEATALHNLAEIHRDLGSPRQALQLYQDAMKLHWAVGNHEGEILTAFGIANALLASGDLPKARSQYQTVLTLSERYGERTMQARALHAMAVLCRAQQALDEALEYMRRAVDADRAISYAHGLGHDLVELSEIHALRAERAQARTALQEAAFWFEYANDPQLVEATRLRLDELEAGTPIGAPRDDDARRVKSHLPLPEGKVYCQFESPLSQSQ